MNFKKIDIKDKKVQIGIIVLLVTIIVGFLWYDSIITNKSQQVKDLEIDYQKKQDKLNRIYAMRPHLQELRENVAMLNTKLDSLRSIFPDQKEVPTLVKDIVRVAHKSGITANKYTPKTPIVKEHYIENIDSVRVTGGYHELATFFNYLAGFEMIINLTDVNIKTNPLIQTYIKNYKDYGEEIKSLEASFNMTTFSSKK